MGDDAHMQTAPTLAGLAVTADAIAATPSKRAKVRLLADHLVGLDPAHLLLATRYFAGRVFAPGDPRTLKVGGAALSKALREVAGVDDADLAAAYRRHGDAGDTTAEVLRSRPTTRYDGVDLLAVDEAFNAIATAGGPKARERALADLLRRCSPDEGRYVVKLVTGDMRIGLREGLVEEAIGIAFERPAADVARAVMLLGDLGEVACLVARGESVDRPRYFSPLRFMLASPVADAEEAVRRMGDEVWVEDKYDGIRCQLHHMATVAWPCTAATSTRSPSSSPRWAKPPRTPPTSSSTARSSRFARAGCCPSTTCRRASVGATPPRPRATRCR